MHAVTDPDLYNVIELEKKRQNQNIELIASENFTSGAVMEAQGSLLTNKYAEGYPGRRWYGGCEHVDVAEQMAIDRVKEIFGADHANVQPHSGSQANTAVYFAVLDPGDKILTMDLAQLRDYIRRCRKLADGFLHYADASVPLFHLAYYLRRFPTSHWTFVRYESIFDPRHDQNATARWLARLFNLTTRSDSRAREAATCNFSRVTGRPFENEYVGRHAPSNASREDADLRALFAPWQAAIEALITSSGHRIAERGSALERTD